MCVRDTSLHQFKCGYTTKNCCTIFTAVTTLLNRTMISTALESNTNICRFMYVVCEDPNSIVKAGLDGSGLETLRDVAGEVTRGLILDTHG